MSKKMMVLALAVVSAAFFALPAMASAQEIHLEPAENFSVAGNGGELRAEGEPTITCISTSGSGKFDTGSTTTGTSTLDFTGCHTEVFGFTASCKSEGAATAGTIASSGTFHLITISSGVPGVLLTTNETTIVCAGISTIHVTGSVIGTITSPACGGSSKTLTLSFTATGTVQDHRTYTENTYELGSKTSTTEAERQSGLKGEVTNTQANAAKLNCT